MASKFISKQRKISNVKGTGVQYVPGHVEPFVDKIIEEYLEEANNIVDLGGGGFRFALPAAMKSKRVNVVDLDQDSLNKALILNRLVQNNFENIEIVKSSLDSIETFQMDVLNFLSTRSQEFDLIVSFRLIHFFSPNRLRTFFNLVNKALRTNGVFAVSGITPFDSVSDTYNELFKNSTPEDGDRSYRRFNNSAIAKKIMSDQNLQSIIHFSDSKLIKQLGEKEGLQMLEKDIISTRIVNGFILQKKA